MKSIAPWLLCLVALLAATTISAADPKVPAEFVQECDYYVGEWSTEVKIGEAVYRGKWIVDWSQDRCCLETHWAAETPTGPASGTRVEGWDGLTKKVLVVDFSTEGSSSIERYTLTTNQISQGEITGFDEGKPFQATARVLRKDQDFFIWTVIRDGQETDFHFHRVKK